jgi:hypothetical protein
MPLIAVLNTRYRDLLYELLTVFQTPAESILSTSKDEQEAESTGNNTAVPGWSNTLGNIISPGLSTSSEHEDFRGHSRPQSWYANADGAVALPHTLPFSAPKLDHGTASTSQSILGTAEGSLPALHSEPMAPALRTDIWTQFGDFMTEQDIFGSLYDDRSLPGYSFSSSQGLGQGVSGPGPNGHYHELSMIAGDHLTAAGTHTQTSASATFMVTDETIAGWAAGLPRSRYIHICC